MAGLVLVPLASLLLSLAPPASYVASSQRGSKPCPSCGTDISAKGWRRHLAFCAPDLLDPEGWSLTDREVVMRQVRALHREDSEERRALQLRFGAAADGGSAITSQQELAQRMGWSTRRTRDVIARLLHSIPPVGDIGEEAPLTVLYEDNALIAVDKPPGVGVTPSHRLRGGSVLNRVIGHLAIGPRDAAKVPRPCHRLDLDTSGVLIYAKTAAAAADLMRQFETRSVKKTYCALCTDQPTATSIDASICKVAGAVGCERRACEPGESGGQNARSTVTVFATAAADDGTAEEPSRTPCLVLVRPEHGRTHQVRVHCSELGAPLVGDALYGGGDDGPAAEAARRGSIDRYALHALKLECTHPTTGKPLEIASPMPSDMRTAAQILGVQGFGST